MKPEGLDVLLLTGRPASGKSEIIDFLTRLPADERLSRYHLKELDILDDFPMLWTWLEEDAILKERLGRTPLHTDGQGDFIHPDLWHLLIERLDLEYTKRRREADYHTGHTALIEFSRGSSHGGYAAALPHLGDDLLSRAALLYVNVSFEESLRKNRRRFNPDRPDSILEHGLSDEKMERMYREDDFSRIAPGERGLYPVRGVSLPYVVFENNDDVTTGRTDLLAARLAQALDQIMELRKQA